MEKIINLDSFRKRKEEDQAEVKEKPVNTPVNTPAVQNEMIKDMLSEERLAFLRSVLREYVIDRDSRKYKSAYTELNKKDPSELVEIINTASNLKMEMEPTRFAAARDVLFEKLGI